MDSQIFDYIRCPITKGQLSVASDESIAKINERIRAGRIRDRLGREVTELIESGLTNDAIDVVYPVRNSIPTLIPDEALVYHEDSD